MKIFGIIFLAIISLVVSAQKKTDPVYVDKHGVMRWSSDKKEATFFGVNYTVPFAYGFRSHKALGVDIEKAIDADVHHMARLGLDAFRVHVWDVDITDSLGNLLKNEHLRLFDYLIMRLKEKKIKILITPIAFWGNGYPEPDVKTNGFSYVYGKGPSVVKEEAFKAQENYLKQFFTHVNPYTKLAYKDDPDVIAMEINNEPHHSGPKERTTEYVNRMARAVKSTGWTKPVFYNISESPRYADAVVKAKVEGHSFQWYPTGLVANHERKGNYLPNVANYFIPFGDTIPAFKKRALMVYEFDAGDVMQPIMYPAMARSYRTAGFQWATQFAYDPLYTAYGNTEYQTHYLNLAYTPAKAISLLIASEVFHKLPPRKSYGAYPADTLFDVFRLSYEEQLAEMNSPAKFYYTGNTSTHPVDISQLKHIAGTGSSPLVNYEGTGAYFLDKRADGQWRLEVMPDAIAVEDPFERASPSKHVVRIFYRANQMKLNLPDLGNQFSVRPVNEGNQAKVPVNGNVFSVVPGVYLLASGNMEGRIQVPGEWKKFYAPPAGSVETVVVHHPAKSVTAGKSFMIQVQAAGLADGDKVQVELRNSSGQWKTLDLQSTNAYHYQVEVPADVVSPGIINYRIMVRRPDGMAWFFPGNYKSKPYAWDEYRNESWEVSVMAPGSHLELFNPLHDRQKIMLYNTDWRNNRVQYATTNIPGELSIKTIMTQPVAGQTMGWQFYFGDKIKGRQEELSNFTQLVVKARANGKAQAKISLINTTADAYATKIELNEEWKEYVVPLNTLVKSDYILLPRPYPGFLPLMFSSSSTSPLNINKAEKLEISFSSDGGSEVGIEISSVLLRK